MNEIQALFIATLPDVFCDLQYAIRVNGFAQRVAELPEELARETIQIGLALGFVECDANERFRLAPSLQQLRDELQKVEGYAEVAQSELSQILLQRSRTARQ